MPNTPRNWTSVDVVREHIDKAAAFVGRQCAANFKEGMSGWLGIGGSVADDGPESVLEAIFMAWWHAYADSWRQFNEHFTLESQRHVQCSSGQRYRLDYVVVPADEMLARSYELAGLPFPKVAIELDGHAFHEKTLDQVTKRNSRDRDLQADGWQVFHYSWAEFTGGPEAVMDSIAGYLLAKREECERASGRHAGRMAAATEAEAR